VTPGNATATSTVVPAATATATPQEVPPISAPAGTAAAGGEQPVTVPRTGSGGGAVDGGTLRLIALLMAAVGLAAISGSFWVIGKRIS
jgi:hypothetical protein